MRKVIQISDGVHLCDDGTMWEKVWLNRDDPDMSWVQLPNVPQSEGKIKKPPKPPEPPKCRVVIDGEGGVQNNPDCTAQPPNTEYIRGR